MREQLSKPLQLVSCADSQASQLDPKLFVKYTAFGCDNGSALGAVVGRIDSTTERWIDGPFDAAKLCLALG